MNHSMITISTTTTMTAITRFKIPLDTSYLLPAFRRSRKDGVKVGALPSVRLRPPTNVVHQYLKSL
jgi:hypothetical protein